jgi:hypothetical protein
MARIVYDGPDGVERLEDIAEADLWYHADTGYWVVRMDEADGGDEEEGAHVLRRIPDANVYYVEQRRTEAESADAWSPEFE